MHHSICKIWCFYSCPEKTIPLLLLSMTSICVVCCPISRNVCLLKLSKIYIWNGNKETNNSSLIRFELHWINYYFMLAVFEAWIYIHPRWSSHVRAVHRNHGKNRYKHMRNAIDNINRNTRQHFKSTSNKFISSARI